MALSPFLNFSSSPSCRTGLLLLVELIRLAGLEAKTEGWNDNDEVGLAGVEPKTKDWNDEVGAGGSITLLGGGEGAGEPKKGGWCGEESKEGRLTRFNRGCLTRFKRGRLTRFKAGCWTRFKAVALGLGGWNV